MTDAQILKALCERMDWDGTAWWLPDLCIKEGNGRDDCPQPTMKEFREILAQAFSK